MKRKIVEITPEFFGTICKSTGDNPMVLKIEGVPTDAKFIGVNWDFTHHVFQVAFEHDSFEDIPEGNILPIQKIKHTKSYV